MRPTAHFNFSSRSVEKVVGAGKDCVIVRHQCYLGLTCVKRDLIAWLPGQVNKCDSEVWNNTVQRFLM